MLFTYYLYFLLVIGILYFRITVFFAVHLFKGFYTLLCVLLFSTLTARAATTLHVVVRSLWEASMFFADYFYFSSTVNILTFRVVILISMYSFKILYTLLCIFFLITIAMWASITAQVTTSSLKEAAVLLTDNFNLLQLPSVHHTGIVISISVYFSKLLYIPLILNILWLFTR